MDPYSAAIAILAEYARSSGAPAIAHAVDHSNGQEGRFQVLADGTAEAVPDAAQLLSAEDAPSLSPQTGAPDAPGSTGFGAASGLPPAREAFPRMEPAQPHSPTTAEVDREPKERLVGLSQFGLHSYPLFRGKGRGGFLRGFALGRRQARGLHANDPRHDVPAIHLSGVPLAQGCSNITFAVALVAPDPVAVCVRQKADAETTLRVVGDTKNP